MISIYSIPVFITSIIILVLGIFVFAKNSKSLLNKLFFFFCSSAFIWLVGYSIVYSCKDADTALFWARFSYIGVVFIATADLHFSFAFVGINKEKRKLIIFAYVLSFIFLILSRTDLFLIGMTKFFWGYYPKVSFAYYPFIAYFYLTYIFIPLYLYRYIWGSKRSGDMDASRIMQLKYVFWAFMIALPASMDYIAKFGFQVYPAGYIFMLCFVSILAYAIARHRLLDIEVVIKKTLVFAGLLASVFAMLILPTLIIQEYLLRAASTTAKMAGLAISGIIIILTMRRIENFLINITDKYLFQKKYDYKALLKTFTAEVLTVLELDKLVNLTVSKLVDIVKLQSAAVLLFDHDKQQFNVIASHNIKDPQVTFSRPAGKIGTDTYFSSSRGTKISVSPYFSIIYKLNAELIIPMVLHEEVIGVLSLGKKKSDEEYTQDDLDILLPLAKTLAIAVSNAQLFDELGKTQAEAAQKEKMAVIGTLAAGMAHEIRSPISTIKIFSDYLGEKIEDGAFRVKYKDIVVKEVDKIDHIIQTMIDFSGDTAKGEREEVSVSEAIDELISSATVAAKASGKIRFVKDLPPALSGIKANRKEFDEVLMNLAQNAINAIEKSGVITFSVREDADRVEISVKDTGCGIPAEVLKNIFDPFFTTRPGGFGLGLFIVNELVKRNGGWISVESKEGRGSTFRLEFSKA